MSKLIKPIIIIIAVISVAVGDIFIKKAAETGSFQQILLNKWMGLGVVLYMIQIFLFAWMFYKGWELGIVGIMQTVIYAIVILAAGHFMFKEYLNSMQLVGLVIALVGVVIANIYTD